MSGPAARALFRRARSAALATNLDEGRGGGRSERGRSGSGWPYASLVTVACDVDASPILLLSDLSDHTRNLARDDRASLLIEAASGRANPQTGPRVSLLGRIVRSDDERHRRRFLARHPSAAIYADFADFNVYRMVVERAHYVGGFGRASWLRGDEVLVDATAAAHVATAEPAILERMQGERADVVARIAPRRLARPGDGWRLIAVDPDGFDLRRRNSLSRLDLPAPVAPDDDVEAAVERFWRDVEPSPNT